MQPNLKILVVEDDDDMRQTLQDVLEKHGYDVDTADDGISALNKLWLRTFDIVLTDIMMPGMNGFKLMTIARAIPPRVDFLVITGNDTMENREEAARLGAKGYLRKPFTPQELLGAVQSINPGS